MTLSPLLFRVVLFMAVGWCSSSSERFNASSIAVLIGQHSAK